MSPAEQLEAQARWRTVEFAFWLATMLPFVVTPDYLVKIADNIPGGRTICAFGEACSWPVQSFVAKFKDEFVAKGKADEERRAKENPIAPAHGHEEPKKLAAAHH